MISQLYEDILIYVDQAASSSFLFLFLSEDKRIIFAIWWFSCYLQLQHDHQPSFSFSLLLSWRLSPGTGISTPRQLSSSCRFPLEWMLLENLNNGLYRCLIVCHPPPSFVLMCKHITLDSLLQELVYHRRSMSILAECKTGLGLPGMLSVTSTQSS